MLAKLNNNKLEYFTKKSINVDGVIYTNNDAIQKAKELGYKEVRCSEFPMFNENTQIVNENYIDMGEYIQVNYNVVDL